MNSEFLSHLHKLIFETPSKEYLGEVTNVDNDLGIIEISGLDRFYNLGNWKLANTPSFFKPAPKIPADFLEVGSKIEVFYLEGDTNKGGYRCVMIKSTNKEGIVSQITLE